jgi:ABC-type tungstate transport system substrate-binding protein
MTIHTHTHTHTHIFAEIDQRWTVMLIGMIGATVITVTVGAMIIGGPVTTVTATVTTATATGTCVCVWVCVSLCLCLCVCVCVNLCI